MDVAYLRIHDEYRRKSMEVLEACIAFHESMPLNELKRRCKGTSIHTPKSCKKAYLQQLHTLYRHFKVTTCEVEGGEEFREDISRRMLQMYCLLTAGIGNAHHVKFLKWSPKLMATLQIM